MIIKNHSFLVTFVLLIILSFNILGQKAKVVLEPESILIGEHCRMLLNVEAPMDSHVKFPVLSDTVNKNIEIIEYGIIDTTYNKEKNNIILNRSYTITSYNEGYFPIEPFEFKMIYEKDTVLFESDARLLTVETVEVDLQSTHKDIKPIIELPLTFYEILPYILLAILLISLILFIIYYFKYKKQKASKVSIWENPEVPAYAAALSKLEALRQSNYLKQEKFKQFHIELTDILRYFLEKRFNINAPEMTSGEILSKTKDILEETDNSKLTEIFSLSDLVKFAKHKPNINESEKMLKYAFEIVKNTIPVEEKEDNTLKNES